MEEQRKTCLNQMKQKLFFEQTNVAKPHLTSRENKTVQAAWNRSGSCRTDTSNNPSALFCKHRLMGGTGTMIGVMSMYVNGALTLHRLMGETGTMRGVIHIYVCKRGPDMMCNQPVPTMIYIPFVGVVLHTWKSSNATMFSCFSSCRNDRDNHYLDGICLIYFYIFEL